MFGEIGSPDLTTPHRALSLESRAGEALSIKCGGGGGRPSKVHRSQCQAVDELHNN